MLLRPVLLAYVLFAATACTDLRVSPLTPCGNDVVFYRSDTITLTDVSLLADIKSPYYYLHDDRYVIKVAPETMSRFLQEAVLNGKHKDFQQALAKDYPISDDTDLWKYALNGRQLWKPLDRVLAELIEAGDVSIVDIYTGDPGKTLQRISLIDVQDNCGEHRYYCDTNSGLVMAMMGGIC